MLFAPSFFAENKFLAGFPQTTLFLRMVDGKELTKFRSSSSPKPSPPLLAHFLLRVCISAPRSHIRSRDFAYRRGCRLPALPFRFPDILPLVWVPLFPDLGVQALQGARQGTFRREHRPLAFREGVELQSLRILYSFFTCAPIYRALFLLRLFPFSGHHEGAGQHGDNKRNGSRRGHGQGHNSSPAGILSDSGLYRMVKHKSSSF